MPKRESSPIRRRTFLVGLGASRWGAYRTVGAAATAATAATAGLSGCTVFGGTATTRTETVQAPPPIDPLVTLIATTRLHVARIDAAITAVGADPSAVLLTQIRADRAAHLAALLAEEQRSNPAGNTASAATADTSSTAGEGGSPAPQLSVPADPTAAVAVIRTDAETAQLQFTDGVAATGRYRAAIFASISACLATHRSVLV